MPDYEKMYFRLAAEVAGVVETLEDMTVLLIKAQQECEEIYLDCK